MLVKMFAKAALLAATVPMMAAATQPALSGSPQMVGTVTAAQGDVLVSHNGALVKAAVGRSLAVGDRVITSQSSFARVSMGGCRYSVAPTSILAVSGCGKAPASLGARSMAQDAGQDDQNPGALPEGAATVGLSTETVVIGVLAAAALIGGGVALIDGAPSSP